MEDDDSLPWRSIWRKNERENCVCCKHLLISQLMTNILLTFLGLVLLLAGGDMVVRGAIRLSRHLDVSPLLVGITVVGFGTSLPELAVCIDAVLRASPGLAIGNVIGSNIANTLLILGIAAAICPVVVDVRELAWDNVALIGTTALFTGAGIFAGRLEWWHGVILVATLGGYIVMAVRRGNGVEYPETGVIWTRTNASARIVATSVCGFAAILVGAELLVRGAVGLSFQLGVPEEVIGLTVVAIGTSLPEITTAVIAAWRKNTQLCLGNVIGSNLFNISGIAAITSLIAPMPFSPRMVGFDLWVLVATTALISLVMIMGRKINRPAGIALVAAYFAYIVTEFALIG